MQRRAYLAAAVAGLAGCARLGTNRDGPTTASTPGPTTRPPADDALVVEETYPVEGTMVELGVGGAVRNVASTPLADSVVVASGTVGEERFSGRARRDRLAPGDPWEWTVAFGPAADASSHDAVTDLAVETRAAYVR